MVEVNTGADPLFGAAAAISTNGNPIFVYRRSLGATEDLAFALCNDPNCIAPPTLGTIETGGRVGEYASIAIGSDGNPVMSYRDNTNRVLKLAACTDPKCASTSIVVVDDGNAGVNSVGLDTSIAIGADGNPVITYHDATNGNLKIAVCNSPTCDDVITINVLDPIRDGFSSSVAIGTDGNPIVAYNDYSDGLIVAACGTPLCAGAPTITSLDAAQFSGREPSITIGSDGNPLIAYHSYSTGLHLAACSNASCTEAVTRDIDTDTGLTGTLGRYPSMTIGLDGNPVISYVDDRGAGDLVVAACTAPACAGDVKITALDAGSDPSYSTATVIGTDGRPVVGYLVNSPTKLKAAVCGNADCAPHTGRSR